MLIQDRCVRRRRFFRALHTVDEGILTDGQALLEDVPECFRIPFGLQGDSRDVQRHDPKIHPTGIDFISVFVFPALQEGTATHRCLETACQFNDLIVHQHIRIHPFRGASDGQLFDVIVWILRLQVCAFFQGEDQFWEDRCPSFLAQSFDAHLQYGFLDFARKPISSQTESECGEWCLSV
ncbi:hypothetical protein SDC9_144814 [bioreactor metagenome]|uniref:Uncharacterized protein n=1 Tax=bioreactor metagenome TaxID=1076179 RepID=A0A645E898_9ZZZZ